MTDAALLAHITRLPHGRANFKQLVRELGARGEARQELEGALGRLAEKGELIELRSGQYAATAKSREFVSGRIHMHRDGYGFLIPDRPVEGIAGDIYIPATETTPEEIRKLSLEVHLPIVQTGTVPRGPAFRARPVRVGLYKPWVANLDEGWTRFVLERYGFPFENLSNEQMRSGAYRGKVGVILLPSIEKEVVEQGAPALAGGKGVGSPMPPPYAGGLGKEGGEKLQDKANGD